MAEEDIDLTKTCPSCASPNISLNRKGQTFCRDCGDIAPAGSVVSTGIYSKIKGILIPKGKKPEKAKKKAKKKVKGRKRAIIKKGIKKILKVKKKSKPKKAKKKISKKKKIKKRAKKKR